MIGIRNKCQQFKFAGWVIALFFVLSIIAQCIIFHWIIYGSTVFSPVATFSFYARISLAVFFAGLLLLTKRKYWSVGVSACFAIWSMAELIYFRSNNIFIEKYAFTMMNNMAGVWDSIWIFNYAEDWLLILPTAVLFFVVWLFYNNRRHVSMALICFVVSFLLNCWGTNGIHRKLECSYEVCPHKNVMNPFAKCGEATYLGFNTEDYVRNVSVIHSFIYQIKELVMLPFGKTTFEMSNEDIQLVKRFEKDSLKEVEPKTPLIILLVESFEAWTITPDVTPNIYKFINEQSSVLYARNVSPQVRHGVSGDGQLIVNTGLLPITDGATCFRFPGNVYPSICKLYKKSALIAALSLSYWNQKYMSDSYGIKQNYVVKSWHDKDMFAKVSEIKEEHDYILSLTMTMHAPFHACPEYTYPKVDGMSEEIYNYLNSVKYMDKHLGALLDDLKNNPKTKESTIVITADHNVLSNDTRVAFEAFNQSHNLGFDTINGYIPLIVYSPQIKNKILINDPVYQMDIYPTLLDILGCENYYWKGFGVSLLDEGSWNNRPISSTDAQKLSDKMIRANYFH